MSAPTSRTKRQPEYSNKTPRLPGHLSIYDLVSFVLKSRLGVARQSREFASLGVMLEFKYIERGPITEDAL